MRSEESAYSRYNRTIETTDDNPVTLMEDSVAEDHIDGSSEALHDLHFQHRSLESGQGGDLRGHLGLRELDQQSQQIGYPFSRGGRGRHQGDVLAEILVLVVEDGVHLLLRKLSNGLQHAGVKLLHHTLRLLLQALHKRRIRCCLPREDTIHLIQGNDEGSLAHLEEFYGFDRLLFQPMHEIHHKDGNIAERGASRTQVRKGLVSGCVDDKQTGYSDGELRTLQAKSKVRKRGEGKNRREEICCC